MSVKQENSNAFIYEYDSNPSTQTIVQILEKKLRNIFDTNNKSLTNDAPVFRNRNVSDIDDMKLMTLMYELDDDKLDKFDVGWVNNENEVSHTTKLSDIFEAPEGFLNNELMGLIGKPFGKISEWQIKDQVIKSSTTQYHYCPRKSSTKFSGTSNNCVKFKKRSVKSNEIQKYKIPKDIKDILLKFDAKLSKVPKRLKHNRMQILNLLKKSPKNKFLSNLHLKEDAYTLLNWIIDEIYQYIYSCKLLRKSLDETITPCNIESDFDESPATNLPSQFFSINKCPCDHCSMYANIRTKVILPSINLSENQSRVGQKPFFVLQHLANTK